MDTSAGSIIQFAGISKYYKEFHAVSNMNLEIRQGEILGFVGPNGAGKTTAMKMLAGLLLPSSGEIRFRHDGNWIQLTPHTRNLLMERMGFLVESPTFYSHMTPRQLLTYYEDTRDPSKQHDDRRSNNNVLDDTHFAYGCYHTWSIYRSFPVFGLFPLPTSANLTLTGISFFIPLFQA